MSAGSQRGWRRGGTASDQQEDQLVLDTTATLRRAYCLEQILQELREHGLPPVGDDRDNGARPMRVYQQEGFVELYLPLHGKREWVALTLNGMSPRALQLYEAIHNKLAKTAVGADGPVGEGDGQATCEGADALSELSELRRRYFFSALHCAPPSVPVRAGSAERDALCSASSTCSSSAPHEPTAAAAGDTPAVPSHPPRRVEVVEILDTLAAPGDVADRGDGGALSEEKKEEGSRDGPPLGAAAKGAAASVTAAPPTRTAPRTVDKENAVTVDDDGDEDGGEGQSDTELTPPPRRPLRHSGPSPTAPGVPVAGAVEDGPPLADMGRWHTPSQAFPSSCASRQRTPSQIQREMEEFFPSPRPHGDRSSAATAAVASEMPRLADATTATTRSAAACEADEQKRAGGARGRRGHRSVTATAARIPSATDVVHEAPGVGGDVVRMLYNTTGSPSSTSALAPLPATGEVAARARTSDEAVTHLRTLRRRARDYDRFAEDDAYAQRTYGSGVTKGEEDGNALAAPKPAAKEELNTPRQFWDITFTYPTQPSTTSSRTE